MLVISHTRLRNPHHWMLLAGWWFISNVLTVREWKQWSVPNMASGDKTQFVLADKSGSDVRGKDLLFSDLPFVCLFQSSFPFSSHQPPAAISLIHLSLHPPTFACEPVSVQPPEIHVCTLLQLCARVCALFVSEFLLYLFVSICLPQAFSSLCF